MKEALQKNILQVKSQSVSIENTLTNITKELYVNPKLKTLQLTGHDSIHQGH